MKIKIIAGVVGILIAVPVLLSIFANRDQVTKIDKITPTDIPITAEGEIETKVIAENLDTPWGIAFLPGNDILVTERPGRVRLIDASGQLQYDPVLVLNNIREAGEGGLLGIAAHPNFYNPVFSYIYLYYTYHNNRADMKNRVVRYKYKNNKLINEQILIDNIPGSANHNGGRIRFGPDGYLYITTGDTESPSQAQDINSLAGKILRITDEGKIPEDNPFGNAVYTYGHINGQGLAWDSQGLLWETEHGSSNPGEFDEINLITKGKNYGWPVIQGREVKENMEASVENSGTENAWAPAGADFVGTSLFFGGLRGAVLYEAVIKDKKILNLKEHLKGQYGRIRDVVKGPDGYLYITTSNQDGGGLPAVNDDRIVRVKPVVKIVQ